MSISTRYGFRRIGTTVGENARCQRCNNEKLLNLADVWEWSGNRKAPDTPAHRFENYELYVREDKHGIYLPARGGKWRLVREPLLSVTEKYNKADSSESEIEFLCQACRKKKKGQVAGENRRLGEVKKTTREEVLERDIHRCVSCREAEEKLEVDHITPVAEGGDGSLANLQTLCRGCHLQKTYGESSNSWSRPWRTLMTGACQHPYFKVEAHPCSVAGREGISLFFSYNKVVPNKAELNYEIAPSVPIPYGLEGFRDLSLYRHGSEPGNAVLCKSANNTRQGLNELCRDVALLGRILDFGHSRTGRGKVRSSKTYPCWR